MSTTEAMNQRLEKDLQRLAGFRLLDGDFMNKCFEGRPDCAELVLRIILGKDDLTVTDVRTQAFVENLLRRSVQLDVLATDSAGRKYNIEIQRADRGAGRRRARYNSSMMDVNLLEKGEGVEALPETYVIFITEHDVLRHGLPVYTVERCVTQTGELFDDGAHIVYVNGTYRDDTPIGRLMHDFSCTRADDMHYEVLAGRVRFFKEDKEGVAIMCKAMEELWKEGVEQGIEQGIERGIEQGIEIGAEQKQKEFARSLLAENAMPLEAIARHTGLAMEAVLRLRDEMNL